MKLTLLALVGAVSLLSTSALHAQSADLTVKRAKSTARTTASVTKGPRRTIITNTPPTVSVAPRTDGVIPRAIRSGSPLQMINPFAPAAYGNGQDVTRHEPSDPDGRAQGIKLATVEF